MSILSNTRDVLALCEMEKRLGRLREAYMRNTIRDGLPPADFLRNGEQQIKDLVKATYYNAEATQVAHLGSPEKPSPDKDFAERETKLAEEAVLACHKQLAEIPFVGHPDFSEGSWS